MQSHVTWLKCTSTNLERVFIINTVYAIAAGDSKGSHELGCTSAELPKSKIFLTRVLSKRADQSENETLMELGMTLAFTVPRGFKSFHC